MGAAGGGIPSKAEAIVQDFYGMRVLDTLIYTRIRIFQHFVCRV
jgi:hypothetical protein